MSLLFPLMWLKRVLLHKASNQAPVQPSSTMSDLAIYPALNTMLDFALRPEAVLVAQGISIPLGTSLLVVATKPKVVGSATDSNS
jgi:hypothetical protein